ncbi:MAG TPA: SMP-30/gluconolactonase/LRE family protein [Acidobacteriaceae bacterium]|nr:SMP-30/gluconolactonase/LRE family protein [Acidobacteriaceae bacterium]
MRIAPSVALATLLSPFALLPRGPMSPSEAQPTVQQQTQPQQAAGPSILRLDPALDHLIAPGTVPQPLAGGFKFTEGPMWHHGRLWFVDEEGDKIHAVTADGVVSTLVDYQHGPYALPGGAKTGPNAMATAPDGTVVAMQQYARDVVHLTEDPGNAAVPVKQTPFFDNYNGKHLNSPNDIVFAPDGSFYFTDPPYGLKGRDQDPAKQLPYNAVFHYKNGHLTPVVTDLTLPNGIGLSPDNKTLYVNNSGPDQRVIAYPLQTDGSVGPGRNVITFTGQEGHGVPDGLKVDSQGHIWSTGPGGIRILTPQGKVLGQIHLPETAANLAWGDADGQTLYITASSHVYKLRALLPGNLPIFRR